jgi:FkbH-like protein
MENLKYTEILQLNKAMVGKITTRPYSIAVLSNVTINSFKDILEYSCRTNQIEPAVEIGNFDNIVQDSAVLNKKDLVIVFYDTLNIVDSVSGFFEDIDDATYNALKQKLFSELGIVFQNLKSTPSVIFNLFSSDYFPNNFLSPSKINLFIDELNAFIKQNAPSNFNLVDISSIYAQHGIKSCIDNRFYLSSKAPYTVFFFKQYTLAIESIILKNCGKLKKAILFDCDNTLWKGIVGEDGMKGIDMSPTTKPGVFFNTIQKMAVYLSKKGVIVGLCSKNNEADVLEVLRTHEDIVLKEEHIVISKINWHDKASNLRAIAAELNIGTDSLVFVDDSNFEINLIREQLPEILTVQVPTNASEYPDLVLKNIYKYFNLAPNSDDVKKTQMYKEQFQRENSKSAFGSIEDYLASLEIELKILKDDKSYVPRIAQLTQKTNQFNLTTYRYTENQIEQFMSNPKQQVYAMFVKDKFGDNGLTGVCIVKEDEKDKKNAIIDSLLMSCRIIGRNIEYVYVNTIIENIASKGYQTLSAQFIPTKKNAQVEPFYENLGLQLKETKEGVKSYALDLKNFKNKNIDYIKVVSNLTETIKN